MFKKSLRTLVLVGTMVLAGMSADASKIDKSQVSNGIVKVNHESSSGVAVRISKGSQKKDFLLQGNDSFPLQFGEGEYDILVLEGVGGNQYKKVESQRVVYKSENKNSIYLQSVQGMNWNKDMKSIKLAGELTVGLSSDREKVEAIYNYITSNIKYDDAKAASVKPGYVPSIDTILTLGEGICYDYAVLFGSMLRSLDIPAKVVEGEKNDIDVLHAWNEVLIDGQWVIIDTTYDAGSIGPSNMVKNSAEYTVARSY